MTVPYADWNLLKFPDKDQAMAKIQDLAMLSDIFPTGYHGAWSAGVTTGSTVYIAGAGPVGLAAATSAHLLGAAVVVVGDMNVDRLRQAASFGCETIDLSTHEDVREQLQQVLGGSGEVDAAVDCVGFEARGHGTEGSQGEAPATVLNSIMDITRSAGKLGIPEPVIPELYVTGDPGAVDEPAKVGSLSIRIGLGWAKSHSFTTGQCPVMKYNRQLMMAILHDKVQIAKNVNATVIPLDQAPQGYQELDKGAARKYILDPHGMIPGGGSARLTMGHIPSTRAEATSMLRDEGMRTAEREEEPTMIRPMPDPTSPGGFWHPMSLDTLILRQGVRAVQKRTDLALGIWGLIKSETNS